MFDINIYYKAARIYNSGFIDLINLSINSSNHCYALDIVNRLIGWSAGPSSYNALIIRNLDSLS
jgi:hypothetical protein